MTQPGKPPYGGGTRSTTEILGEEFLAAMSAEASREWHTPSPILQALIDMLVKTKRIAAVLGIARPSVTQMLAGRRPTPARHEEKLLMLLRDAVRLGRQACLDAESGKTKWKGQPFPKSAVQFMRGRIDAAEKVLRAHEKAQS